MSDAPDFEALRAARNESVRKWMQKFADDEGVPLQSLRSNFDPSACYCDCAVGGPCEHRWDGPEWVSEDGRGSSATCARCGCTAMSHDLRFLP